MTAHLFLKKIVLVMVQRLCKKKKKTKKKTETKENKQNEKLPVLVKGLLMCSSLSML